MQIFLVIAAVCFAWEAVTSRSLVAAGLFFWVLATLL